MKLTNLIFAFLMASGLAVADSGAKVLDYRTNLGPQGNKLVKERYYDYLATGARCSFKKTQGTRILLTGFGLFSPSSNISSAVVKSAFSKKNFPDIIDSSQWSANNSPLVPGQVGNPVGVESVMREISIDGKRFSLCLLALDVIWDFAAAVIVTEMNAFQPQHVFMFGKGTDSVTIEGGALNSAAMLSGFTHQGVVAEFNRPISPVMFNGLPATLALSIDQEKTAMAVADSVEALGLKIKTPPGPRPTNDYICNNVAFTAQAAANGEVIKLAGDELVLIPRLPKPPVVGFIHFSDSADTKGPAQPWMRFLVDLLLSTGT